MEMPKNCGECRFCIEYNRNEEDERIPGEEQFYYKCVASFEVDHMVSDGEVDLDKRWTKCPLYGEHEYPDEQDETKLHKCDDCRIAPFCKGRGFYPPRRDGRMVKTCNNFEPKN